MLFSAPVGVWDGLGASVYHLFDYWDDDLVLTVIAKAMVSISITERDVLSVIVTVTFYTPVVFGT